MRLQIFQKNGTYDVVVVQPKSAESLLLAAFNAPVKDAVVAVHESSGMFTKRTVFSTSKENFEVLLAWLTTINIGSIDTDFYPYDEKDEENEEKDKYGIFKDLNLT